MRITIDLDMITAQRLIRVAVAERRPVRFQAEVEIERALARRVAADARTGRRGEEGSDAGTTRA